jgi:hypothetical protein
MDERRQDVGLSIFAAGAVLIVVAVLLFGLTTGTGAVDPISVVTAVAGAAMAAGGLFIVSRNGGRRGTSHPAS